MSEKKNSEKKSLVSKFTKAFIIISIVGIFIWSGVFALNYVMDGKEEKNADGSKKDFAPKKTVINALVCGVNDNLTDTIMYARYDVETGKISMMSIPRDTYVTNEYCIGHKINAIYRGKNIVPLVSQVEKLLDVKIDYYLVFDANMVIELVDAIGGVEVDVPINMKYDDPTQNLHINLKKGVQVLNGKKVEQFVRFRHNNDGTGYAQGDIERIQAQQSFMKVFMNTILNPKNITKLPEIVKIALENTDTNVTVREALKYVSDATKINTENILTVTAPGEAKYIDNLSYFLMDEDAAATLIKEKFNTPPPQEEVTSKDTKTSEQDTKKEGRSTKTTTTKTTNP
ncbi:MAG: LCP family protein [Clostridia bacterium]